MHERIEIKEKNTHQNQLVPGETRTNSIVKILVSAYRTYSLYPEDHSVTISSLKHTITELSDYIENYGSLVITIEKDGLYSNSRKIIARSAEDDGFISPLFRDGIVQIEFVKGIELNEIKTFFGIIKKNKNLSDEPDSDTVTDFWHADFQNIHYHATDDFFDSDPYFSFPEPGKNYSKLPENTETLIRGNSRNKTHQQTGSFNYRPSFYKPANLSGPLFSKMDLTFHPDELIELKKMIREEENSLHDGDVLGLLLIVLEEVTNAEDLTNVLSSLTDEFGRILKKGEVYKAYSIIENVLRFQSKHSWMHPFVEPAVESFMRSVSGSVFLRSISGIVPILNTNNPGDVFFLRKICMTLESTAVLNMCKILVMLESQTSRDILLDIVKMKSREDSELIDRMVENPDKVIVLIGISLLKTLKDNNSDYLLHKMLKHKEDQVRLGALAYFLEKPVTIVPRIFFLIDDPNMDIRQKLLDIIGSKRSVSTETLLLNYLSDKNNENIDRIHLANCYRALGKCGSDRCIPFLKKKVFDGAWTGLIGSKQSGERTDALLALSVLDKPEAVKLLKKASKSKSPLLIKAYKSIPVNVSSGI